MIISILYFKQQILLQNVKNKLLQVATKLQKVARNAKYKAVYKWIIKAINQAKVRTFF